MFNRLNDCWLTSRLLFLPSLPVYIFPCPFNSLLIPNFYLLSCPTSPRFSKLSFLMYPYCSNMHISYLFPCFPRTITWKTSTRCICTFALVQLAACAASTIAFPTGWMVFDSTPAANFKTSTSDHIAFGFSLHQSMKFWTSNALKQSNLA